MPQIHHHTTNMSATQQVTIQPQVAPGDKKYAYKVVRAMGIANIVIGIAAIILGIIVTVKHEQPSNLRFWVGEVGVGIWTGGWILINGIFGTLAGKKRSVPLVIVNMVFNICTLVICGVTLIFFSIAMRYFREYISYRKPYYCYRTGIFAGRGHYDEECLKESKETAQSYTALYSLLLVSVLACFIISIVSAGFSCKTSMCECCWGVGAPRQVIVYTSDGVGTVVPVSTSGNVMVPMNIQPNTGYPPQVWGTISSPSAPATTMTCASGLQAGAPNAAMTSNLGAVGGYPDAPPSYTEKAPSLE